MSEISNGQNGIKAVEAKEYEKGIELLTKAINVSPSPAWLLSRSIAYQRTSQLTAALDDADAAYHVASERTQTTSKQQMIDAQYRRGVILFQMDRPADADACCVWSQQIIQGKRFHKDEDDVCKHVDENGEYKATAEEALNYDQIPKDDALRNPNGSVDGRLWTRAYMMRQMTLPKLAKLPLGDPRRKIAVERVPPKALGKGNAIAEPEKVSAPATAPASAPAPAPAPTAQKTAMLPPPVPNKPSLKFDFFQTDKSLSITVFIKGLDKVSLKVQVSSTVVTISDLPLSSGAPNPLYLQLDGAVKEGTYNLSVTPNKIEISLEKAMPGPKWKTWGKHHDKPPVETIELTDPSTPAPSVPATLSTTASQTAPPPKPAGPPAYPTSSKSGPKDWDNLDGADDMDDPDVNTFFKQLYKDATPEQQRAMMKSFTESNGTALSTDWADVGTRRVEVKPPEGVEPKKW